MSEMLSIRHNFPDVIKRLERLPDDVANKAMARALNATVQQAQGDMAREIGREFRLTQGEVRTRLRIARASSKGPLKLTASLLVTNGRGRSLNLARFMEKVVTLAQARTRMKGGEGGQHALRNGAMTRKALELRFQIKRTGGKKMIKGAFLGNDGRTVFIRQGKDRLPIKALSTIDVPQMFNTKRINAAVRDAMLKRFRSNFDRELRAVLKGYVR